MNHMQTLLDSITPPSSPCYTADAPSPLLLLPIELIVLALDSLDAKGLLTCRMVCRDLKNMVDDTAALQYKIELVAAGMDDGPPSAMSPADRLNKLRRHQEAWNSVKFSSELAIPMLKGEVWELYGGVLAQARHKRSLAFWQLPSIIRGIERQEWTVDEVGFIVRDFTMDPSQDLLVIIESNTLDANAISVHLRDLKSGQPHRLAPNPAVLQHQSEGGNFSYLIQVSRDYLAVLILPDVEERQVVIWNWKTGTRHAWLSGDEFSSFTFLSERHILLSVIPREEDDEDDADWRLAEPTLVVIDFLNAPDENVQLRHADFVCAFHYPLMGPVMVPLNLMVRSDPAPNWGPHPDLQVPFYTAQGQRLLVVTLSIVEVMTQAVRTLVLFVPSSTLLSHIQSMPLGEVNRHIEWNEWGPQGTRMMPAPSGHSPVWVCFVFGTKFASPKRRMGALKSIQVYDFNQIAVKRAQDGDHGQVVACGETIKRGIFQDEVTTYLPYREWTLSPPASESTGSGFNAVMLSEDSLVMVTSDPKQPIHRTYRVLSL